MATEEAYATEVEAAEAAQANAQGLNRALLFPGLIGFGIDVDGTTQSIIRDNQQQNDTNSASSGVAA